LTDPALPLPVPGSPRLVPDYIRRRCVGAGRLPPIWRVTRQAGSRPSLKPRGSLALAATALYKTFRARHPAAWDTMFPSEARAAWRSSGERSTNLSGSSDRPVPDGGIPVLSGAAGSRKVAERLRLAQALRANLGRRKAQKVDRRNQTGNAVESKTVQGEAAETGAGTKQD
jgi:hypothetical protein